MWTKKTKKAMRAIEIIEPRIMSMKSMNGERADAHEFPIGGIWFLMSIRLLRIEPGHALGSDLSNSSASSQRRRAYYKSNRLSWGESKTVAHIC